MFSPLSIQSDTHMVVDTATGLKIVVCNTRNYFSDRYAVQMVGSLDECKQKLARLKNLEY